MYLQLWPSTDVNMTYTTRVPSGMRQEKVNKYIAPITWNQIDVKVGTKCRYLPEMCDLDISMCCFSLVISLMKNHDHNYFSKSR